MLCSLDDPSVPCVPCTWQFWAMARCLKRCCFLKCWHFQPFFGTMKWNKNSYAATLWNDAPCFQMFRKMMFFFPSIFHGRAFNWNVICLFSYISVDFMTLVAWWSSKYTIFTLSHKKRRLAFFSPNISGVFFLCWWFEMLIFLPKNAGILPLQCPTSPGQQGLILDSPVTCHWPLEAVGYGQFLELSPWVFR